MPQRHFYRPPRKGRLIKFLVFSLLFFMASGFLGLIVVFVVFSKDLPDPSSLEERSISQSTKIYDRAGRIILYDIHGEERRTIIPFSRIPQVVKDATIVAEDKDFYKHRGIDFKAIVRAILANIRNESVQGGSTITQQFIKNSILSPERTLQRKIKEAILALEMERKYSKNEILNFYLNQISYGSNAYGIEAAAQTFFSKTAAELTLAEAAMLASLPKAPSYYSPYGPRLDELIIRQRRVLEKMAELGYISKTESEKAKSQSLALSRIRASIKAPHFVFYVKDLLEEKYGEDYIEKAGLKIITTLDWDLQQTAEEVVTKGAEQNDALGAANAALVALDPKTGQVLAMVGSRDYFKDPIPEGCQPGRDCKFEGNVNVATRARQPGSAFKPFVYTTAFKKGYTDKTVLFDVPTEFTPDNPKCPAIVNFSNDLEECYHPKNFDLKFRGPLTVRAALANSVNVPSVEFLYLAGVDDSINTAEDMGVTTLKDRSRFGLSLVLGGGEVKLLELTSAFGVFATEGIRNPINPVLRVENSKGELLEEFKSEPVQVLDPEIARMISSILSDNNARIPVFGARSPLFFENRPVAAKTGTTDEFRDGWTVGYTPSLAAGVWVGNNDNTPINKEPGVYVAAPIWREFLLRAFDKLNLTPESFTPPEPKAISKPILNGEYIINGEIHTTLYYIDKNDPQGPPPPNPEADPQFKNWEAAVRAWLGLGQQSQEITVTLIRPQTQETVSKTFFVVEAAVSSSGPVSRVDFFWDEQFMGSLSQPPYLLVYNLVNPQPGDHKVNVRAFGANSNMFKEATTLVKVAE